MHLVSRSNAYVLWVEVICLVGRSRCFSRSVYSSIHSSVHLSVCLSVRPSVRTYVRTLQFTGNETFHLFIITRFAKSTGCAHASTSCCPHALAALHKLLSIARESTRLCILLFSYRWGLRPPYKHIIKNKALYFSLEYTPLLVII